MKKKRYARDLTKTQNLNLTPYQAEELRRVLGGVQEEFIFHKANLRFRISLSTKAKEALARKQTSSPRKADPVPHTQLDFFSSSPEFKKIEKRLSAIESRIGGQPVPVG